MQDFGDMYDDDDSYNSNVSIPGLDPVVMLSIIQDLELRLKHVEQMLGIHVPSQSLITCPRPVSDHSQSLRAPTGSPPPYQVPGMQFPVPMLPPCSTPVSDRSQMFSDPTQSFGSPPYVPLPMLPAHLPPPCSTPVLDRSQMFSTPTQSFGSQPSHVPLPMLPAHLPPPCSTPVSDRSQTLSAPTQSSYTTEVCTRASTLPLLPRQLLDPSTSATTSAPIVQAPQPPSIAETARQELPSSAIRKETLNSVEVVLAQSTKLKGEGKAGTLAQKLAKECIFGEDVLKQCTPLGTSTLPALPSAELKQLKLIMLQQFPQYWRAPEDFETIWGA